MGMRAYSARSTISMMDHAHVHTYPSRACFILQSMPGVHIHRQLVIPVLKVDFLPEGHIRSSSQFGLISGSILDEHLFSSEFSGLLGNCLASIPTNEVV
jgi:hypothetical protein